MIRDAIFQGLFISLVSQIWLSPNAGLFRYVLGERGIAAIYALLLAASCVVLLWRSIGPEKSNSEPIVGTVKLPGENRKLGLRTLLVGPAVIFLSQILSVLQFPAFANPFWNGGGFLSYGPWRQTAVTFVEVFGGLLLGCTVAVALASCYRSQPRQWIVQLSKCPDFVVFGVSIILIFWIGVVEIWSTLIAVALNSVIPALRILLALECRQLSHALIFALDGALPFAFVVMLFWESMAASAGLGFYIVVNHAAREAAPNGLAVSITLWGSLVMLSFMFRWLGNNLFSDHRG